eukprot:gene16723-16903_t
MLSKNMELQETKIGTREIQIFVDKLRSSKMNAMYLNLLQACCSCEGDGVDGNQRKVVTMLFSNTNDIIIFMSADYNKMIPTNWISGNSSIYVSLTPIPGSPIRGDILLTKGIPTLSLAWTTNSIDFSPLGLFGKLSVNVAELFKPSNEREEDGDKKGASKSIKNKKRQAAEQKAAVANYMVAEMFLGAELCMDRNYIAMNKLDSLFPYEMLLSILKLNVTHNIKSAAVRLLMCLHIDRDPQAQTKVPCLTRAWSDVEKFSDPQLPFVEPARRYVFGLVQQEGAGAVDPELGGANADEDKEGGEEENPPQRPKKKSPLRRLAEFLGFVKAPIYELETMVEAVDILAHFYAWNSGTDSRSPPELFEQTITDSEALTLGVGGFDDIMIDVLMYVHTPLVQSTLEVLMAHHSKRRSLLNSLNEVQLLTSHGRERQFRIVQQMLLQLENNSETEELWGTLDSEESRAVDKQTKDILIELAGICRVKIVELEFDAEYKPDPEIQTLYCNLGCLPICMKILKILENYDPDDEGNIDELGENCRVNCRLCNELLYWFFYDNPKNQEEGFEEMETFLGALDSGIEMHKKLAVFLVSVDHPDYAVKRELMRPFLTVRNVSLEELPPLLSYHIKFVETLTSCCVGNMNISAIEAKVQSVLNFVDIIDAILDPDAILLVKIKFCSYLYHAFIQVELKVPGLENSPSIWRLLESFKAVLNSGKDDIILAEKYGWHSGQKLPYIADPVEADVRYESFIKKLVFHIRENIKFVNNQKQMDPGITATSRWIIRAFRTMIENRMGMSIYERDDEGGEEQDIAAAPVVNALNTCGATALCLDLIAYGIDEGLQLEAIKLGVGLLFKEGGAIEVQSIMNAHLQKSSSDLFFKQVRVTIHKLIEWHKWKKVIILEGGAEPTFPDEVLLLRLLQLMCEGHFLPNQQIMREQPFNSTSYNLLDDFATYLDCLVRLQCRTTTVVAIRLASTILEVLQGPCSGNQAHFTLNTELIETLNRLNRTRVIRDCVEDEEVELKRISIDILQALLEGQGGKSVVFEKLLSVLHLDIIQYMSKHVMQGNVDTPYEVNPELHDSKVSLKTECVVLLLTLCNFRPTLYDELGISRKVEDIVGSGMAMIEYIWRDDIHRRFFHIPKVCSFLAKSSKDNLIEYVDRSNAENKLVDFLNRSHDLYREVKHQQLLMEMNLSRLFNLTNKERASWITFILAFAVNMIILFKYQAYGSDKPNVAAGPALAIEILNYTQAGFAFIVLLQNLVVRVPVTYQKLKADNKSQIETIFYTAAEPMTLYYLGYLAFVLLGSLYSYNFLPFLLLDIIVKNSTTQDVLNSVIFPRNQIAVGAILTMFIIHIYGFFLFLYFREDGTSAIQSGVGDAFRLTLGRRWVLDVTFYLAITVGMLNLISGVIITTFGKLRGDKAIRYADTVGVCFICSIDKQIFDRASAEPEGFKTHVKR